ncbi:MAG TPA: type II secretion system protein GspG [Pyrinomonadaceae bacterium]
MKEKDARRAVAEAPGFALRTGAVKVKEVSPAGSAPVTVSAGVTVAFRLVRVEDERVPQTGGVFKVKRWRAAEFRTGDRAWEEFDLVAEALGPARVEAARRALEELVTEFEAQQAAAPRAEVVAVPSVTAEGDGKGKSKDKKKDEEEKKTAEPLTRGPLTVKQLSLMGSSAVAEVEVAASFILSKDARGRWRVTGVEVGGETARDLEALRLAVDVRKAARAREDLAEMREALEAFRRERGFYVVGEDAVVLYDHLSPRYAKRVIRLDPWHNPYRYAGTTAAYTLASDGPDGKRGTADDVTLNR